MKTENSIKYLGIIIDTNLNFMKHCEMIKSRVTKRLNVIKYLMGNNTRNHPYTNLNLAKHLYSPLYTMDQRYGEEVGKVTREKMDILINSAIRISMGLLKSTKVVFLREMAEIPWAADKLKELAIRLVKNDSDTNRKLIGFQNRFSVEKLYIRHLAKNLINEDNINNLDQILSDQINVNNDIICNLYKEQFPNSQLNRKNTHKYIMKVVGLKAKRMLRVMSGICIDRFNQIYICDRCNIRNSLEHIVFECGKHNSISPWRTKNFLNCSVNDISKIVEFLEEIDFKVYRLLGHPYLILSKVRFALKARFVF